MQMIQSSDPSIKSYYVQKLSTDLNIPVESLVEKRRTEIQPEVRLPKIEKPRLDNKNTKAERYIIFAMLRSKKITESLLTKIKPTDFADHVSATIRIQIEHYYEEHTELDLNDFLDTLTTDQRVFMETVMLKDMFWTKNLPISEEEIVTYVKLIKEANLKRRLEYINEKIAREELLTEALTKERDQILVLLKHTK